MIRAEILSREISSYLILADQLKSRYGEIDEDTLRDTLEGISDLPQLIEAVVRSALDDESLVMALKARLDDMSERLSRFKARAEKKRALTAWAMASASLDKIAACDFSVSLRAGSLRLEVTDERVIPGEYFVPQPSKLDRAGLNAALKSGCVVPGAILTPGEPHIQVRVK